MSINIGEEKRIELIYEELGQRCPLHLCVYYDRMATVYRQKLSPSGMSHIEIIKWMFEWDIARREVNKDAK